MKKFDEFENVIFTLEEGQTEQRFLCSGSLELFLQYCKNNDEIAR
jgi:hypothetical protein